MDNKKPGYIKWILIGCGCLALLGAGAVLFFALVFGGIFGGVMGAIKNSDAYKMSVELVEKSSEVKEEIGNIKSYGWFPGGSVNVNGSSGEAKLNISVTGEKGEGTVETELVKKGGKWNFTSAVFYLKNKEIDLLKEN
jgi:hypothetical protein